MNLRTPSHAAVGATVTALKGSRVLGEKVPRQSVAFVNAVLRSVARSLDGEEGGGGGGGEGSVAALPPFWNDRVTADFGAPSAASYALSISSPPSLYISSSPSVPISSFASLGWPADRLDYLPTGSTVRLLNATGAISKLPGYAQTGGSYWWIQDISATLPAILLDNHLPPRSSVADVCAAPGGKTAQLAFFSKGHRVTAVEKSRRRAGQLGGNLARLGLESNVTVLVQDALTYSPTVKHAGVLLDAPCSASGVARRQPDVLRKANWTEIEALADLQLALCEKTSRDILEDGGVMVYATCSILKREGEDVVAEFIANNPCMSIVPVVPGEAGGVFDRCIDENGCVRVLPERVDLEGGCDAFFAARMVKNGAQGGKGGKEGKEVEAEDKENEKIEEKEGKAGGGEEGKEGGEALPILVNWRGASSSGHAPLALRHLEFRGALAAVLNISVASCSVTFANATGGTEPAADLLQYVAAEPPAAAADLARAASRCAAVRGLYSTLSPPASSASSLSLTRPLEGTWSIRVRDYTGSAAGRALRSPHPLTEREIVESMTEVTRKLSGAVDLARPQVPLYAFQTKDAVWSLHQQISEGFPSLRSHDPATKNCVTSTPLEPLASFSLSNAAAVRKGDRVADFYAGSCAALLAAADVGAAATVGIERDHDGLVCFEDVLKDFDERGLGRPVLVRGDCRDRAVLEEAGVPFDVILADPPYGKRESLDDGPQPLASTLETIARGGVLKKGGRLAMFLPFMAPEGREEGAELKPPQTSAEFAAFVKERGGTEELIAAAGVEFIDGASQKLNAKLARVLVVFQA